MAIKIGNKAGDEAATMGGVKKVVESNQLRLQTLELAVAHLTNICNGLSEDVRAMRSVIFEMGQSGGGRRASQRKGDEHVVEMKLPYCSSSNSSSPYSDTKDDVGFRKGGERRVARKTWAQPRKSDAKPGPVAMPRAGGATTKTNPRAPTKPVRKATRPPPTTSRKEPIRSTKPALNKTVATARPSPPRVKSSTMRSAANNPVGRAKSTVQPVAKKSTNTRANTKKISETTTKAGKTGAQPLPKKGDGRSRSGSVVKLPIAMAANPSIRSLIYGSAAVSVVESRSKSVFVVSKNRS